jgi:hypothetical protein
MLTAIRPMHSILFASDLFVPLSHPPTPKSPPRPRQVFITAPQWSSGQAACEKPTSGHRTERAPGPGGSTTCSDASAGEEEQHAGSTTTAAGGDGGGGWLAAKAASNGGADGVNVADAISGGDTGEEQCATTAASTTVASVGGGGARLLPRLLLPARVVGATGSERVASPTEKGRKREEVLAASAWLLDWASASGPDEERRNAAAATASGSRLSRASVVAAAAQREQRRPLPSTAATGNYLRSQGRAVRGACESAAAARAATASASAGDRGKTEEVYGQQWAIADSGHSAGREKMAVAAAWVEAAAAAAARHSSGHTTRSHPPTISYLSGPQLSAAHSGSGLDLLRTDDPAERQQKRAVRAVVEALAATRDVRHAAAARIAAEAAGRSNGPPV